MAKSSYPLGVHETPATPLQDNGTTSPELLECNTSTDLGVEARVRQTMIRAGLEVLYFSRAHRMLAPFCGGAGAILTLHHVRPDVADTFQSSRSLAITPAFLEETICALTQQGFAFVSLDEMRARLERQLFQQRFVCLTFDDGYRDNRDWAYPVLKRYGVPFAIYVVSDFADGSGSLWWLTIDAAIGANDYVELGLPDGIRRFDCRTAAAKSAATGAIHTALRGLSDEHELRDAVAHLAATAGIDETAWTASLCMTWSELRDLAADPLVTIGAHTVSHPILSKTSLDVASREINKSARRIADGLGFKPAHLAYPFGDAGAASRREFELARAAGFRTAVTTRPGVLFPDHRAHLWALPRISLNGEMQRTRYVEVLASGVGTAVWNGFRRLNVA